MLFNYGAKQHECQQFIEISIKEIVAQCETMAPHYRKIGNYLFGLSNSCRKVFPGRTYLARAVGVEQLDGLFRCHGLTSHNPSPLRRR